MTRSLSVDDIQAALDATGLTWRADDGVFHVDMVGGLVLDVTFVWLPIVP